MVRVKFVEGRKKALVKVANDVVADADRESLACREWARRVDNALDELVDIGDNNLPIGPRGSLTDMIEYRVGLVGVARAEDCKY
jgi:hypothetical protein